MKKEKIIVFASSNEHKVNEIRQMLSDINYKVLSLKDINASLDCEENGLTFEENSLIKAKYISNLTSYPVLSDDSGLSINALDGFPGIHSARFMEGSSYKDKCEELIKRLNNYEDKSCKFICVLTYIDKNNDIIKSFVGETSGLFTSFYDENAQDKFGYDPCFYSLDLKKTFGNSTIEEKNKVSHRSRAMEKLKKYLLNK